MLAFVVGLATARDVWITFKSRFASLSRSQIIQLKIQLQSHKKGAQSVTEYLQKVKHGADNLAAVASPVDDEDLIIHTLNGLPPDYGSFKTSIWTRSCPISIEELHVLLLCEEMNLNSIQQTQSDSTSTAFLTSKGAQSQGYSGELVALAVLLKVVVEDVAGMLTSEATPCLLSHQPSTPFVFTTPLSNLQSHRAYSS